MDEFDVFVSYKSENANVVRSVAETLMADGVRVWFAEYHVLLENYEDFQRAIDYGIDHSTWHVVFTNDRWADSKYCQLEIDRIVQSGGLDKTLQVCIPAEDKSEQRVLGLKNCPICIFSGDVAAVAEFIFGVTKLPRHHTTAPSTHHQAESRIALRFGVSLAPEGFGLQSRAVSTGGTFPGEPYYLEGSIGGQPVELLINLNPFRTAPSTGHFQLHEDAAGDDREFYRTYRKYARWWITHMGFRAIGLHIFFWNNRSHMALTTQSAELSAEPCAVDRKYVLTLQTPGYDRRSESEPVDRVDLNCLYTEALAEAPDQERGEITFTFRISKAPEAEQLSTLLRLTPVFDRIVGSLRYEPHAAIDKEEATLARLKFAFVAVESVLCLGILATSPPTIGQNVAIGTIAFLVMDVLMCRLSPSVRRSQLRQVIDDQTPTRVGAVDGRESLPSWNDFVRSYGWWIGKMAWRLATDYLTVGLVAVGCVIPIDSPWYWALVGVVAAYRGNKRAARAVKTAEQPPEELDRGPRLTKSQNTKKSRFRGAPELRNDGSLARLHPRLPAILEDLQAIESSQQLKVLIILAVGLIAGITTAATYSLWVGGGVFGASALIALFVVLGNRLTDAIPVQPLQLVEEYQRNPTATIARETAASYLDAAKATSAFLAGRALIWASHAWELDGSTESRDAVWRAAKALVDSPLAFGYLSAQKLFELREMVDEASPQTGK